MTGTERSFRTDERAVSDVIGYVLVFALITATIGAVFTFGFAGLQERQQAEQVNNVERAFEVFVDNVGDIHRNDAPSRSTELRLAGGTLSFGDDVTVRIGEHDGTNWVDPANTTNATLQPLVYQYEDTTYVYESGALFRFDGEDGTMRNRPEFVHHDDQTVLLFVVTRQLSDRQAIGGRLTARIVTERAFRSNIRLVEPSGTEVRLEMQSDRAPQWHRYFEATDGFDDPVLTGDDDTVAVTVDSSRVYVQRTEVNVRFDR